MEKNPNRQNKARNKFTSNQANNINNPFGKRPNKMNPFMNYENNINNPYYQNQEYPMPNTYQGQTPMPMSQTKEQNIKNMFKAYQSGPKKYYHQYNQSEFMPNLGENEMSLEDNALYGTKKFNNKIWNKTRMSKKRKNMNKSNKDLNNINVYNNNKLEAGQNNINNRAISTDYYINNEDNFPESKFNDDINYNNYWQKGGKKKATTVENNNRNRNKKGFIKNIKKFNEYSTLAENAYNSDFSDVDQKSNNIKIYNNVSDIDEDSHLANNDNINIYSNEEESNEQDDKNSKNSQDIIIIEDNSTTPKEVLDLKKINSLVENPPDSKQMQIRPKNNKKKIIPELTEMCSKKEIEEREKDKDLDRFEVDPALLVKKPINSRMVQKYQRKRGKLLNLSDPKEIRTIPAINKSIQYLVEQILDTDKTNTDSNDFSITPMDIISFVNDRFIAICKTIEILVDNGDNILNDCTFVENVIKIIRTIIIFFNLCLNYFDDESPKRIKDSIDNILLPLLEYIKDMIINESNYEYNFSIKNKDEIISYYLLLKLKTDRNNFMKYYKEIKGVLTDVDSYEKMKLVYEIYTLLNDKNYEKFIEILKNNEKCDYLFSCFLSLFFKEICVYGLMKLSLEHKELSYRKIVDYLTFEDSEEAKKFLQWYGINEGKSNFIVNESDKVSLVINNKNKKYNYNLAPQRTNFKYVEKKIGKKLRKDIVSQKIDFIKNKNYNLTQNINNNDEKISKIPKIEEEKVIIKNTSLINSDIKINKDKSIQNIDMDNSDIDNSGTKKDLKEINNINSHSNKNNLNTLNESFISKGSYNKLFPSTTITNTNPKINNPTIKIDSFKESSNKSFKKLTSSPKDDFLKPLSPKKISFDIEKPTTSHIISNIDANKSLDIFSQPSISSIEGPSKYYSNINEQTIEYFCDVASSVINKIITDRKFDFLYKLKFIAEKYKIKLELIENYINRRKFFVFNELKKCCLNKKYTKEYYKELIDFNNNISAENTNENYAFKNLNYNLNNKKFELLTYEDIIYFLIKDFDILEKQKVDKDKDNEKNNDNKNKEENENENENVLINHLQINIYTTKDLIRSTKILSTLKIKKNLLHENSDGSELTIIDNNININSNNKLSLIIKFIFVDQIIDLDSYIYDNQKNISKYSILIPFFDIIKSDPENQQILTKFFTILDLGLGSYIKKDIIFFFIKRDIEQTSDLYRDYQNMQNDFIFNLMQKYYSNTKNKNNIIYIDDDYDNNEKVKEKIIYLSPIDEFGKCYQEYIKYLNNKTFVELFEKNKLFHLNVFNPKEKLIPLDKHIVQLNMLINYYINNIENDLKKYLIDINCINFFYSNKLCIEILIGFIMCKILLIYYQYVCLSFANELFKIPFYNSNNDLLVLEDNLLNSGSIFRQINLDGYDKIWNKYFNLDTKTKKNMFTYFDIFSEIICSYNLISDSDVQSYEYCFRKQYYDIDLEKKNYEISKNFVNYFNKIIIKFVSNNNLRIKNNNTAEIFKSIYNKNKIVLLHNIAKIVTNNSICFNEGSIYIEGVGDFYHGLEKIEILEYNKNLAKKRKRDVIKLKVEKITDDTYESYEYEPKKKSILKLSKRINININKKEMNDNYNIVNNIIDINESIDKNKKKETEKYSVSNITNYNGDVNEDYYKSFRTLKKYTFPNLP